MGAERCKCKLRKHLPVRSYDYANKKDPLQQLNGKHHPPLTVGLELLSENGEAFDSGDQVVLELSVALLSGVLHTLSVLLDSEPCTLTEQGNLERKVRS